MLSTTSSYISTTTSTSTAPPSSQGTTLRTAPLSLPVQGFPANFTNFNNARINLASSFPGGSHEQVVQQKNLERGEKLKELDVIEKNITRLEDKARLSEEFEQKLQDLKVHHKELTAELKGNTGKTTLLVESDNEIVIEVDDDSDDESDESNHAPSAKSRTDTLKKIETKIEQVTKDIRKAEEKGYEKKTKKLIKELHDLKKGKKQLKAEISEKEGSCSELIIEEVDDNNVKSVSDSTSTPKEDQTVIFNALSERNLLLKNYHTVFAKLQKEPDTNEKKQECIKAISTLVSEILSLEGLLDRLGAEPPETQPDGSTKSSGLTTLVRSKTKRDRTLPAKSALSSASKNPSPEVANFNDINQKGMRSSLRFPEDLDLKKYFNEEGVKEIHILNEEMEDLAHQADTIRGAIRRLKDKIGKYRQNKDAAPKTLQAFEKRLKDLETQWIKLCVLIEEKLEKVEKLENKVRPQPLKSAKQVADEYKALIEQYKSPATKALEAKHKDMLDKLQERIDKNFWYRNGYDLLSGGMGFTVSFLLGNSIGRCLPAEHGIWVPSIISGGLHVITATPVVKQLIARNWSADALSALNNNFKLRGAGWGDYWRNETNVPKYSSKNSEDIGKLTNEQRMAQEKSYDELHADRYKTEEAGYWLYTMNYTFKAVAMAAASSYFAGATLWSRSWVVELLTHAAAGGLSGAGYIATQQHMRSQNPKATMTPTPTREIYAADAAAKKSLGNDLRDGLTAWKEKHETQKPDPNDLTERHLHKAIARTERERHIAEQKSWFAGTLRYEFKAQFTGEAKWDTLSEALGRILTLFQVSTINYLTIPWRKSPDPLLMFLGHFLPAVALMNPTYVGGFTARPEICGYIRAGIQMFLNGRAQQTVATQVPRQQDQDQSEIVSSASEDSTTHSSEEASTIVEVSDESTINDSEDGWDGNVKEEDKNIYN